MKILVVSKCPTHPTDAGNRWWILSQTKILQSLGCDVHFLFVNELPLRQNPSSFVEGLNQTAQYWQDKVHIYNVSKWQKLKMDVIKHYRILCCKYHWNVDDEYPNGLEKYVNALDEKYHFDICIINYYYLSKLFDNISIPKKAIATHDAFAYKNLKFGFPILCITASTEAKALQRCPHIFALQEQEANYFQIISPRSEVYNFYGRFEHHPQPVVGNHKILFLSGNNIFNQNGIKWFLQRVFPLIKKRFPDAQLLIGGSICKVLPSLEKTEGVKALGYVNSPEEFYAQADVAINPVYQGTGLKIKTFESISYDKVTIVHPHSMTGVFKQGQAPLFASDKPQDWVTYLEKIWNQSGYVDSVKKQNRDYLKEMNEFIMNEYKRFLNS